MANHTIYTRAYSKSSAGQLVSAKGLKGEPLSHTDLVDEFRNHANRWNREPTALVSVSDRIIDTVKRAFDKHYTDGECPADIWVAFIQVPATIHETPFQVHAAQSLAEECSLPESGLFYHEFVFEWAIPEKYVVHQVSLQTLMDRGFQSEKHLFQRSSGLGPLSTAELRYRVAGELQPTCHDSSWEIGVYLGHFARKFGARAPVDWISHQLFYDCVQTKIIDDDVVKLNYAHGPSETVNFDFFCELDRGIETVLCDWWLAGIDFFLDYEEFKEWQDTMKDDMAWDQIEFWETWHDVGCGKIIREVSEKQRILYDKAQNELLAKHEEIRAVIEAKAVMIGL